MIDIYQQVTDKIVAQIEANPGQWTMPWRVKNGGIEMPRSADGRYYRGVNVLVLWSSAMAKGYQSPHWATYNQWKKHDCQVRRGEKGEMVVFFKKYEKQVEGSDDPEKRWAIRSYYVFNAEQVDGWEEPTGAPPWEVPDETSGIGEVDDFFHAVDADVRYGGSRACYIPSRDYINMPSSYDFHTMADFYSTLGHEHIHWTGHTTRLDRKLNETRFGDKAYAFEELVAELGAAFLMSQLEVENGEPRPDHAQYLAHWLTVLKNDKKAIFTAASQAQAAVDFLMAYQAGFAGIEEEEEAAQ